MKVKKKKSKARYIIKVNGRTARAINYCLDRACWEFLITGEEAAEMKKLVKKLDSAIAWTLEE